MRITYLLSGILFLSFTDASGQNIDTLLQLHRSKTPNPVYVNFDVVKIMIGNGFSSAEVPTRTYAPSFELQLLWPYAALRKFPVHIVGGISLGYNSMAWKHTEWLFSSSEIIGVIENSAVHRSVQKSGFIGLTALPLIQLGKYKRTDIMAGVSARFHFLGNKMVMRSDNQKKVVRMFSIFQFDTYDNLELQNVRYITLPAVLQISYKIETLSFGIFGTYDLVPRFKSQEFKDIKQIAVGLSGAIKI